MIINTQLPSYIGLILILIVIFSGQAFRDNWKTKKSKWVVKAWIYGLLSLVCFIFLFLIPLSI